MGEVFLDKETGTIWITSVFVLYGSAADEELAFRVTNEVETSWNETDTQIQVKSNLYTVRFKITGYCHAEITPDEIHANLDPCMNFFRIEPFSRINISFVDEINCNTGYFLWDNLNNNSTTAAHEYGHTLGLSHPAMLDIRGGGQPGIMYPRGTLVDARFQWDPKVPAGVKGGTLNPMHRKVLSSDIHDLKLDRLKYNKENKAIIGDFTNLYHNRH